MEDLTCWHLKYQDCTYSIRLLDKLALLNEQSATSSRIDIIEVKKAIYYARKYHGEQKRQSGEPYYSHPIEVAYLIADYLFRTDIIVTSILHDTIEDTNLSFEMIQQIFGDLIANQVMDLTRIKEGEIKITSAVMVEELWLQKKYDILMIKMFDRLHNMQTIGAKSPEKTQKIIEETISSFIILAIYLEMPVIKEKLSELCIQSNPMKLSLAPLSLKKKLLLGDVGSLCSLTDQNKIKQIYNLLEQAMQ